MGAVAPVEQLSDAHHRRTLRLMLAGREVSVEDADAAMKWLRADATVVATKNGTVRLRVPVLPQGASDIRGSRS